MLLSVFFFDGDSYCNGGKARVENGKIDSVFTLFEDNTYEFLGAKFYNSRNLAPEIINGISEMMYNDRGEEFKIIFIDQLKPKEKIIDSLVFTQMRKEIVGSN
jgi:hypothetical protein